MEQPAVRSGSTASAAQVLANDRKRQKIDDHAVTGAGHITLRQSILPVSLVTVLFFMWGFAYGLLDVLNAHFQTTLGISQGMSGGLQAAYVSTPYLCGPSDPNINLLSSSVHILLGPSHTQDGLFVDMVIDGLSLPVSAFMVLAH